MDGKAMPEVPEELDPLRQETPWTTFGPGDQVTAQIVSGTELGIPGPAIDLRIGGFQVILSPRDALGVRNLLADALEAIT